MTLKHKKACPKGHTFYKGSDCPVCPICEKAKKAGLFANMAAPVRRAMENNNIKTLKQLSRKTEAEVLEMHGVGPSAIPRLKRMMETEGLGFKK